MVQELIGVAEAARTLGVGRSTVHYLVERGDLRAHRLPPTGRSKGHKLFLERSQVVALADGSWRRSAPRRGER